MYEVTTDDQSQQQVDPLPAEDIVYLILEDQRRVDSLVVVWLG